MKKSVTMKILSCLLVLAMMLMTSAVAVSAEADTNSGKYVKEVFIAYGEKKEDAEKWLRDHGYEPFADLNEGKTSNATGIKNAVAVMGIKRTDDPKEAITDMAVMNMGTNDNRGYSFDDYESLVAQKKADIDEFIKTFIPALEEYRDNYNGKGSEGGKKRAQMAHDLLNKFFDGDPNGDFAVNDTGKPLGDLLLNKTKTETGDEAYNKLSKDQKLNVADFQQIILESSGPAVQMIEQVLALATDTAETSWLQRLDGLTGEDLVDRIAEFAPEAEGQDLAPSAAMSLLAAHFEDYSKKLASEWIDVHENILWFERYCDEHELWQDKDSGEFDNTKLEQYFNALNEEDEDRYDKEFKKFNNVFLYYFKLKNVAYAGDWGETLFDFFRPEDDTVDYSEEFDYFAPIAAALSDGQRAALEFIRLTALLRLGVDSDSVMEADFPSVDSMFKDANDKQLDSISIYSGINRAIFRKGVALTSDALMQKSLGKDPYEEIWDEGGVVDIVSYVTFGVGTISLVSGAVIAARVSSTVKVLSARSAEYASKAAEWFSKYKDYQAAGGWENTINADKSWLNKLKYDTAVDQTGTKISKLQNGLGTASKWMMGIGGALMIAAAALKGVQIYKYYHRDFTMIPVMIVDESDIVSYTTDKNGKQVKLINFDQFAYYDVVKCNRQEIGIHKNAQNGVSDYKSWGCGDAADINADVGKQWLAMYVNRSSAKGDPILADTLMLQKGSDKKPDNCNGCLHFFTFENAAKLDDTAYCYRDDNKGMYIFWKGDETAFAESTSTGANTSGGSTSTASAFNAGYLALAGIGGLALGILCTTLVMLPKLKKKEKTAE